MGPLQTSVPVGSGTATRCPLRSELVKAFPRPAAAPVRPSSRGEGRPACGERVSAVSQSSADPLPKGEDRGLRPRCAPADRRRRSPASYPRPPLAFFSAPLLPALCLLEGPFLVHPVPLRLQWPCPRFPKRRQRNRRPGCTGAPRGTPPPVPRGLQRSGTFQNGAGGVFLCRQMCSHAWKDVQECPHKDALRRKRVIMV